MTDSLVHEYFMNDKLRAEGHIKVEFPEVDTGQCYYYDEATGGLLEKFFYGAGGKLDGEFILYYPQTGKVQTLETFRNGVQEGPSMSYYPDGTLKYSIMFVDGHEDGEVRSYYPDGSPMEKFSYNNGKLDGAYEQYFQDGDIMAKGEFKDGQKTGNWVIYSHSGRAFQENYKSHSDPDYNLVDASLTPEDAYFEGYYAGNDDGKQDASVYDPERKSFDDNSAYSGEFLKSYKSGYAVGYADGYKPKKR